MLRFRKMRSLQVFASAHASISNHFNLERSLSSRDIFKANRTTALTQWHGLCLELSVVRVFRTRCQTLSGTLPRLKPSCSDKTQ